MSDKYEIKTLDDFLNIPESRIDDCLTEFKEFLNCMRAFTEIPLGLVTYTWIDDKKGDLTINIHLTEEKDEVNNEKA